MAWACLGMLFGGMLYSQKGVLNINVVGHRGRGNPKKGG